jgi:hypothetical protein
VGAKPGDAGASGGPRELELRAGVEREYGDIFTPEAMSALAALATFEGERNGRERERGSDFSTRPP